jgi:hypothetical protein
MFLIEDELHCEHVGHYTRLDEAVAELRRLAELPWDEAPNQAPCMSWRTCERRYVLTEYEDRGGDWTVLSRTPALNVSAEGKTWLLAASSAS